MNMKKWAFGFAVLLATSVAFAESEEGRFPQSEPIQLPGLSGPPSASPTANSCAGVDQIQPECEKAYFIARKACKPEGMESLSAEVEKMKKNEKEDGSSMNGSCDSITAYNKKLAEYTTNHLNACKQALPQCIDFCRTKAVSLGNCPNAGTSDLAGNAQSCEGFLPTLNKNIAEYKAALKDSANKNSCSASAATGDEKKDTTTASDDKKDEKGMDIGKLLSAAMPLLGAVLGDGTAASTVGGVAVDAPTAAACMQPANFQTCECNASYCKAQQSSVTPVGASLTNTGGAALTANAEDVKIAGEQWTPGAMPTNNEGGGSAAAAGYVGGGGGLGGGHGNFTPDAPKGRAGSSLNADILAGVKGGGGGGTASAAGAGGPRSFDTPGLKDPEKLPGYALGAGTPTNADLKSFMPPPPTSAARGLSGMLTAADLHPASAIGWNEISKRYRMDTFLDPNLPPPAADDRAK